ncbi:MAG: dihydrodipicolinate reductase [Lachnospiraceae bacterium]|nr:dihydrodipicolinate reductase [Lachnospiraceae bacterium]
MMTRIKEKAVEMIQRMPDDNMFYVINILQNLEEMTANKDTDREQAMKAFQDLLKFSGRLPEDFDADKELAAAREEKYGNIG